MQVSMIIRGTLPSHMTFGKIQTKFLTMLATKLLKRHTGVIVQWYGRALRWKEAWQGIACYQPSQAKWGSRVLE